MDDPRSGSEPRRILYVETNEDGTVGGSHKIMYDLVVRLSPAYRPTVLFYQDNVWSERLRERGVEVLTWDAFRRTERQGLKEGGKVSTALTLVGSIRHRRSFLKEGGFDLVHMNNSPYLGYDDWLPACRLLGIPCVTYTMGDVRPPKDALQAYGIRQFARYFPLSRYVEDTLLARQIDPERIVLAYPGLDLDEIDGRSFRPAEELRTEFNLNPNQLLVVMVGNIRLWKGQHVVVEALAGLSADDRKRIRVLLVGDTNAESAPYEARLHEAVRRHGLERTVVFTGRRDDVPDLLEAADIAVHSSVEPEPFGLVVQEAMIHGCATIAADRGGPVEMITEDSGITFSPEVPSQLTAALERLIQDESLRSALAEAARQRARFFDQSRHVAIIEQQYGALLGAPGVRPNAL